MSDPHEARSALDQSADARTRPIVLNKDLRLTDVKGADNQLQPGSVRDNIVRAVLARGMTALTRLDEIHDDMTRRIPRFEELVKEKSERFAKWDTKLNDLMAIRDDITKSLKKQLGSLQKNLRDATFWSTEHHGLAGVADNLIREQGWRIRITRGR